MNVTCWTDSEVEGLTKYFHKEKLEDYFLEDI